MFPGALYDDRLLKAVASLDDIGGRTRHGGMPGSTYTTRTRNLSNEDGVISASKLLAIQFLGR